MNREHRKKHIAVPAAAFSYPGRISSLLTGSCPVFFPADGVIREDLVHLYFITDGYEPLKEKTFLSARQCLLLMKEIVMGCRTAADWLWNGEELVLSLQTVWINERGNIRFLCIPEGRREPEHRRLFRLTEELKTLTDQTGKEFLGELQHTCFLKPQPYRTIISQTEQLIRQLEEYSPFLFIK